MNSNRGQYSSAPLNNIKRKKPSQPVSYYEPESVVPAPGPGRSSMRRYDWLAVIVAPILPILFLLALLIPSLPLRAVYLALTLLTLGLMWLLHAFARSARGVITIIYSALAVVIGLALLMEIQSPELRAALNHQNGSGGSTIITGTVSPSQSPQSLLDAETPAPEEDTAILSAAATRMQEFFFSWSQSDIPAMLEVCSPAWVSQQSSPKTALWNRIQQQVPVSYTIEQIDGSDANTSRTITVLVQFMRQSDQLVRPYRLQIIMLRVNDQWYIDPQSLDGTLVDTVAENPEVTPMAASTKAPPTATPDPADQGMILYYNTAGGQYYHTSPTCSAVDQQYWPLTGTFYYSELNSNTYKHLKRCTKCDAPPRN